MKSTFTEAMRKRPLFAIATIFWLGVAATVAAIGVADPQFFKTALQVLLFITMCMGGAYLGVQPRKQPARPDYSAHFRQSHQRQRVRLGFGMVFTTIRNGQVINRQVWAAV